MLSYLLQENLQQRKFRSLCLPQNKQSLHYVVNTIILLTQVLNIQILFLSPRIHLAISHNEKIIVPIIIVYKRTSSRYCHSLCQRSNTLCSYLSGSCYTVPYYIPNCRIG